MTLCSRCRTISPILLVSSRYSESLVLSGLRRTQTVGNGERGERRELRGPCAARETHGRRLLRRGRVVSSTRQSRARARKRTLVEPLELLLVEGVDPSGLLKVRQPQMGGRPGIVRHALTSDARNEEGRQQREKADDGAVVTGRKETSVRTGHSAGSPRAVRGPASLLTPR